MGQQQPTQKLIEGISIKLDQKGQLVNMPKQWRNFDLCLDFDPTKLKNYKTIYKSLRPAKDIPQELKPLMQKPVYSKLKTFQHRQHLFSDPSEPFGIGGLRQSWKSFLKGAVPFSEQLQTLKKIVQNFQDKEGQTNQFMTSVELDRALSLVHFIDQNPSEVYYFSASPIGKGSSCKVYRCIQKVLNIQFVCRITRSPADQFQLQQIKYEICLMTMCRSQLVVKFEEVYIFKEYLLMIIQYMDQGSLTRFIFLRKGIIPERVILYVVKRILEGLEFMHAKKLIHRDIKSDNILLNSKGEVKIADFGFATQLTKEKKWCKEIVGTPAWMAPQLICERQYASEVDIWSLGIIIIEMCDGQPPYLRQNQASTMLKICYNQAPRLTNLRNSEGLRLFTSRLLQKQPSKRASAKELLKSDLLKQVQSGQNQLKRLLTNTSAGKQ